MSLESQINKRPGTYAAIGAGGFAGSIPLLEYGITTVNGALDKEAELAEPILRDCLRERVSDYSMRASEIVQYCTDKANDIADGVVSDEWKGTAVILTGILLGATSVLPLVYGGVEKISQVIERKSTRN